MTNLTVELKRRIRRFIPGMLAGLALASLGVPLAVGDEDRRGNSPRGDGASAELTLFEFVGHIDQDGASFQAYGYLTHVNGVPDSELFTGPPANETTAKYTFVSTGALEGRFIVAGSAVPGVPPGSVFNLVSNSSTKYYYRAGGGGGCIGAPSASCTPGPLPFSIGDVFASGSGRDSFTNVVIAPNTGLVSGSAEFTFQHLSFKSAGVKPFPLWTRDAQVRITYFGDAARTDPNPATPKSFSLIAGRGTVIR